MKAGRTCNPAFKCSDYRRTLNEQLIGCGNPPRESVRNPENVPIKKLPGIEA